MTISRAAVCPYPDLGGMALPSDGKVVVVGRNRHGTDDSAGDWLLLRLTADGPVDTTFGDNGYVLTSFYNSSSLPGRSSAPPT